MMNWSGANARAAAVRVAMLAGLALSSAAVAQTQGGQDDQNSQGNQGGQDMAPSAAVVGSRLAMGAGINQGGQNPDRVRKWSDVSKDLKPVISTVDGNSFYNLWIDESNNRVLAELPRGFERQRHFFAMTVAGGELYAGLQGGDEYVRWERFGDRMALIRPQISVRSGSDRVVGASVERLFTDQVLLDVGIVAMGPSGQPVIDLNELLLNNAQRFFGGSASGLNSRLVKVAAAKAFPENIEIAFEAPVAGGTIKTFHYSISHIKGTPGFKPRAADERVGYFVTTYRDLSKTDDDEVAVRYINRWHIEKAEPSLKMSPPKEPIVYYVEHTVPVRYRRWVREGVDYWNEAFRNIGIDGAIEVRFQDMSTGAHMDKDPEDVRYNFIRWLANDIGTAIGPSRVNPMTGEILDADVVLTDGWLRYFDYQWNELVSSLAMQGFGDDMMAFFAENPDWDPRVRLAMPEDRERIAAEIQQTGSASARVHAASSVCAGCGGTHETGQDASLIASGDAAVGGPRGKCNAAMATMMNFSMARVYTAIAKDTLMATLDEDGDMIDGLPESFVGPLLADLVAHEVGHTLGLRHNFKASSLYTLDEINSDEVRGKKAFTASVMDYNPVNIRAGEFGDGQGDYTMTALGEYDNWVIDYGYGSSPEEALKRVGEPALSYATDEDTGGVDPLARRYDFSKDPLDFANNQMALANKIRSQLLDKFVKDGESWSRARRGYQIALSQHVSAVNMMGSWIGGAFVERDRKGDEGDQVPITPVPAGQQRAAMQFVIDNTFNEEAFGLTPELLRYMTVDKWFDAGTSGTSPAWPLHDQILGVQATAMTLLLNPRTLVRVYDNEFMKQGQDDVLTLPEVFTTIREAAWNELSANHGNKKFSDTEPMISSFRRNLQREHIERLATLATSNRSFNAAGRPVQSIAVLELEELKSGIADAMKNRNADTYTRAHLNESLRRIERALEAQQVYGG